MGTSIDCCSNSSDARVGAAVGFNYENVTNTATIDPHTTITGGGVTVQAIIPDTKENDFVVWGIAAAGGKSDASVAASVAIQVLSFDTEATIGAGSTITSTAGVTVQASNKLGLNSIAISGALAIGGTAVGGAIIVNIFPNITTKAVIDSDNTTDVTTVIAVTATSALVALVPDVTGLPGDTLLKKISLPHVSSVAVAGGAATGDPAVTGS